MCGWDGGKPDYSAPTALQYKRRKQVQSNHFMVMHFYSLRHVWAMFLLIIGESCQFDPHLPTPLTFWLHVFLVRFYQGRVSFRPGRVLWPECSNACTQRGWFKSVYVFCICVHVRAAEVSAGPVLGVLAVVACAGETSALLWNSWTGLMFSSTEVWDAVQ